jgi:hypothetical protein
MPEEPLELQLIGDDPDAVCVDGVCVIPDRESEEPDTTKE